MNNIVSCRVCFADSVKLHLLRTSPLRDLYEKLANSKCQINARPTILCYLCYGLLLKCYRFQWATQRAETVLSEMLKDKSLVSDKRTTLKHNYLVTPVKCDMYGYETEESCIDLEVVKSEKESSGEDSGDESETDTHKKSQYEEEADLALLGLCGEVVKSEREDYIESSEDYVFSQYVTNEQSSMDNTGRTRGPQKRVTSSVQERSESVPRKRRKQVLVERSHSQIYLEENTASTSSAVSTLDEESSPFIVTVDNDVFNENSSDDEEYSDSNQNQLSEELIRQKLYQYKDLNVQRFDRNNDKIIAGKVSTEFAWDKNPDTFQGTRECFTEKSGPTFSTKELTPLECFLKMVEPEFVDLLAEMTNKFASKQIEKQTGQHKSWRDTDRIEMYRFLGLLICQGLYPNAIERGYWYGLGNMNVFKDSMYHNRFILLKKFMNFADSNLSEGLKQIKLFTDYFRDRFFKLYHPNQEVALDVSVLKWKGDEVSRKKLSQRVTKIHELCDAKTGYVWKFHINVNDKPKNPNPKLSVKIVLELVEDLFHKGHTIVLDKLYNSPLLARYFKSKGVDCYGPLRLSRKFVPDALKLTKDMLPNYIISSQTADLSLQVWKGKNAESMISTYHAVRETQGQAKPDVVTDYYTAMRVVDHKKQTLKSQQLERCRAHIWSRKLFRKLFNIAIFNAHVLYQSEDHKVSHQVFRETVVLELLQRFKPENPKPEIFATTTFRRLNKEHSRPLLTHQHFPVRNGKKKARCVWCTYTKKATESRSVYKCMECNVCLCITKCFFEYHTVLE